MHKKKVTCLRWNLAYIQRTVCLWCTSMMKGSDSAWFAGEKTPTRPPNRSSRYSANFRRRKKSRNDRINPVFVVVVENERNTGYGE